MTMDPVNAARPSTYANTIDATAPGGQQITSAGGALLPEPSGGGHGDVGQAMAMMMIDAAFAQRKTAREAKATAQNAMADAQKHQLEEMRAAADERYSAAKVDAWVQIGSGGLTLGAMGVGAAGKQLGNEAMKTYGKAVEDGMTAGGNTLAKGLGGLVSSGMRHTADMSDASAKQYENAGKISKEVSEDWGDDVAAAKESVRKALDFLKEYQSTQSQTQAAALHRA
jgi:hypothetical protein